MKLEALPWLILFLPLLAAGSGVMLAFLLMATCGQAGDGADRLLQDIERCARLGTNAPEKLTRFVADHVEEQAPQVCAFLVGKLARSDADAESLKVYLGCLGLCRHTNGVPALITFYGRTRSEDLKGRCYASLACIGKRPGGRFPAGRAGPDPRPEAAVPDAELCRADPQRSGVTQNSRGVGS